MESATEQLPEATKSVASTATTKVPKWQALGKRKPGRKPYVYEAGWEKALDMSSATYVKLITYLGFNRSNVARFIGVPRKVAYDIAHGRRKVPRAVAHLLRLMVAHGIHARDRALIPPDAPDGTPAPKPPWW